MGMFDNDMGSNFGGSNNGEIIKSGYDVRRGFQGMGDVKKNFRQALELSKEDLTEDALSNGARLEGRLRGYGTMLNHAVRQKQKLANAALNIQRNLWQHANNSANAELQWQRTEARGLEQMSDKLLQLDMEQKAHGGFAEYCDGADRLMNY